MDDKLIRECTAREEAEWRASPSQGPVGTTCWVVDTIFDAARQPVAMECPPGDLDHVVSSYALAVPQIQPCISMGYYDEIDSHHQVVAYALMLVKSCFLAIGKMFFTWSFPQTLAWRT